MILLACTAGFVGFIHSLAPNHWLPVVMLAKARRWPVRTAAGAALVTASGHILISAVIGLASLAVGASVLVANEAVIERYASLLLVLFGLAYALASRFRHAHCHGHGHHGRSPGSGRSVPLLFLLSLGLSPCIAALPIFLASSTRGSVAALLSIGTFALGVAVALTGATVLAALGVSRLDHPVFEHHGDTIAGVSIAVVGAALIFFPVG